jgi:ribosomal protein S18 acetylase RimI-like enzyme
MTARTYTIDPVRKGDARALTTLVRDIKGFGDRHDKQRMFARMADAAASGKARDDTDLTWEQRRTGKKIKVPLNYVMRVLRTKGKPVGFVYSGSPVDWVTSQSDLSIPDRSTLAQRLTEIQLITVHPGHRNQGHGERLLADAEDFYRSRGYRAAMVMVYNWPGNPAPAWFERRGYTFGPPGRTFVVQPWAERRWATIYDHCDASERVGFKSLHDRCTVTPMQIGSAFGLGASMPPLVTGLLD